jgi:hypothetical protein
MIGDRLIRRQFLMASAAAIGISRLHAAQLPVPPGQLLKTVLKNGRNVSSLPDYDRNPFLRPVGPPLSALEMATRRLPGERRGLGKDNNS